MSGKFECIYTKSGCSKIFSVEKEWNDHIKNCFYQKIECGQCKGKVIYKHYVNHINKECEYRITFCKHCQTPYIQKDEDKHLKNCSKAIFTCSDCGGKYFKDKLMLHSDKCPKKLYEEISETLDHNFNYLTAHIQQNDGNILTKKNFRLIKGHVTKVEDCIVKLESDLNILKKISTNIQVTSLKSKLNSSHIKVNIFDDQKDLNSTLDDGTLEKLKIQFEEPLIQDAHQQYKRLNLSSPQTLNYYKNQQGGRWPKIFFKRETSKKETCTAELFGISKTEINNLNKTEFTPSIDFVENKEINNQVKLGNKNLESIKKKVIIRFKSKRHTNSDFAMTDKAKPQDLLKLGENSLMNLYFSKQFVFPQAYQVEDFETLILKKIFNTNQAVGNIVRLQYEITVFAESFFYGFVDFKPITNGEYYCQAAFRVEESIKASFKINRTEQKLEDFKTPIWPPITTMAICFINLNAKKVICFQLMEMHSFINNIIFNHPAINKEIWQGMIKTLSLRQMGAAFIGYIDPKNRAKSF